MLINCTRQMLDYTEKSPIRLLSLPAEQQRMVQRLKLAKQRQQRSQTEPSTSGSPAGLASYRLHTQEMDHFHSQKATPAHSLQLTIHSRLKKERPRRLSILEEQPGRSRLSVLKELMEKNSPFTLSRYAHQLPQSTKLQPPPEPLAAGVSKPALSHLERRRKEGQLRRMLIINRVRESRSLNVVVRRMSSVRRAPV